MKKEIETLLGYEITEARFNDALDYARCKQMHIFSLEQRPVVLQGWYAAQLAAEYVKSHAFSNATVDLCRLYNMEKERRFRRTRHSKGTPIVAVSAL